MNEELKKLYDAIASRGFYTKSYDEFVNQYQDPAYRDKVFDVVTREGLYTKSRNEFDAKYGAAPLKKKEPSVSTSQEGAMAQAAEDGSLASQESAPVLDFTKLRQQQQVQKYGELPAQPQAETTMPPSPQLQQQVMNRMAAGEVDFVPAPLSQVYEKVRAGEQLDPIEQATLDQRKNKLEVERMVENYSNVKGVGAAANAGAQLFLEMLYPADLPGSERASDYARNMNRAYKISIGIDPGDVDKSFSEQKDVQSAAKVFGVEAANTLGLSALSAMFMAPAATSFGVTATTPSLARQAAQTVSRNIAQNPASFALMGHAGSNSAYKQVKNDPTKSEAEKLAYSTYSGLKEMVTEAGFVGDLRAWNQTLSAAERSLAKQTFRSTVSDYLKTLGKQGLEEGTEEGISWAGDLLWALATGDKLPTAREGWEAMALGAVAPGFAVTGQYAPVMADFAAGYLPFTLPKSEDLTKLSELKKRQATIESDLKKEGLSQEERQKLEEMSDGLLNEIESLRASAWESRQNMSDEDFLTLAKIDAEVEGLYQQFEGAKTATMKMAIKQDVADLLEQKRKIENNYAIQEQATDEGVLRPEQPEVGLQEVGERDQEPQVATAEGIEEVVQEEVNVRTIPERQADAESKIKRKDLFTGVGDFSINLGGSDKAAVPVSHSENNGIEIVEYAHPETGSVDVIVTGKSDNDFVGFYRLYENGKPTNRWSSKFENQSRNKEDFKTMISGVQALLPKGHEYTEKTSISTDGLRVWNQQLSRGYELQYDENGNIITNRVYVNGDAIVNELGVNVEKGKFQPVRVTEQEFEKAKEVLATYLEKLGLSSENIYFESANVKLPPGMSAKGLIAIDLPVLKATQAAAQVRAEAPAGPVVEGAAEVDAQELADLAADMRAATPARRERLERIAERARTAVSKILPDVKIIVHDTQGAYRAATTFEGEATYNNDTKTVHINGTKATPAAVAHEVFHAVFLDKVKTDAKAQAVAKKMVESLKRVLGKDSEVYQYLDEFSKDYAVNFQDEEKLAEMVGVLSELYSGVNDIGLSPSAVQSVKNAIKKFITDLAKLFNIPMATTLTDADVLAVLNTIAQKAVAGEVITEADVRTIDRVAAEDITPVEQSEVQMRERKGLITITEREAQKYARIGINDARVAQAMEDLGLAGVKFTKGDVETAISKAFDKAINELEVDMYNGQPAVITQDSPAITRAIEAEITALEEQGASLSRIESAKQMINDSATRNDYIRQYQNAQSETLSQWVSYLEQSEYDPAFKFLMLDAVVTNNYDLKTQKYIKRDNKTIRNITPFDAGTLAELYGMTDSKELLKTYAEIQADNASRVVKANMMKSTKDGKWLKFAGGNNVSEAEREVNATALSQLVQDTYWCTKTNAKSQLDGGDFYVYVTEGTDMRHIPRIAVRMDGSDVGELRGNASSKQDLEPEMLPVAEKFLKEEIPGGSGQKWLDSIAFNKKAKAFAESIYGSTLSMNMINEFAKLSSESAKYNVDYGRNGFIERIEESIKAKVKAGDVTPELDGVIETSLGDANPKTKIFVGNATRGFFDRLVNVEIVIGDVSIETTEIAPFSLRVITGDLDLNDNIQSLSNIEAVGGGIYFGGNSFNTLEDLGKIEVINSGYSFSPPNKIKKFDYLKTINRNLFISSSSSLESLGSLEVINGSLTATSSDLNSLGNLKSVSGDVELPKDVKKIDGVSFGGGLELFDGTEIVNVKTIPGRFYVNGVAGMRSEHSATGSIEEIGGSAYLRDSSSTSLGNLKVVGDYLSLPANIRNTGNVISVGGDLIIGFQIKSIDNLEYVGGDLAILSSALSSLGNIKYVGGNIDLMFSKLKDLGKLEHVGGLIEGAKNIKDIGKLSSVGERWFRSRFIKNEATEALRSGDVNIATFAARYVEASRIDGGPIAEKVYELALKQASKYFGIELPPAPRQRKDSDAAYENWKNGPKSAAQEIGYKYNMNHKGYTPSNIVKQHFKNDVERLSSRLSIRSTITGSGYYMTLDGKFFNPYLKVIGGQDSGPNGLRQRIGQPNENIFDIVTMARQKGYTDKTIEIYLKQEGFAAEDIKDAMAVNSNIDGAQVPQEFGNVTGGMAQGQTLFDEIKAKLTKMAADGASMMDIRIEAQTLLMGSEVYKEQSVEVKAQLRLSLDAAIGTKAADRAFRQEFKQLRAMLADRKKARRELETIKRTMRGFIRKNLPQGEYSKAEVVALLKAIVDANVDTLPLVMEKVEGYVTGFKVRKLDKQIQKLLETKTTRVESGRLMGATTIELQEDLASLSEELANSDMSEQQVADMLKRQLIDYDKLESSYEMTDDQARRMQILDIAMMYNEAMLLEDNDPNKVESLTSARNQLVAMITTGRAEFKAIKAAQHQEYNQRLRDMVEAITGESVPDDIDTKDGLDDFVRRSEVTRQNQEAVRGRIVKAWNAFFGKPVTDYFDKNGSLHTLLSRVTANLTDQFGGPVHEMVYDRLKQASIEFERRMQMLNNMIDAKGKEIFGKDYDNVVKNNRVKRLIDVFTDKAKANRLMNEMKTASSQRKSEINLELNKLRVFKPMSQNQIYYLYNQFKDVANRSGFEARFGKDYVQNLNDLFETSLDPKVKEWADWQVLEFYPSLYEAYNDVYKKIFRTNMPWNPNYAGRLYREKEADDTMAITLMDEKGQFSNIQTPSSTKMRRANSNPIKIVDGDFALTSYLGDMEYFRAYGETIRDVDKLFRNKAVQESIKKVAGDDVLGMIKDQIKLVGTRGTSLGTSAKETMLDKISSRFSRAVLMANPSQFIKQATSLFAFANRIGFENWAAYTAKAAPQMGKLWNEFMDNAPRIQKRYNPRELTAIIGTYKPGRTADLMPKDKNGNPILRQAGEVYDKAIDAMMWPVVQGDKFSAMAGAMGNYLYYKEMFLQKNPSATNEQAIKFAADKVSTEIEQTLGSADVIDKDFYQNSGNALYRAFSVLQNSPKAMIRQILPAYSGLFKKISKMDKRAGVGTLKQNLETIFMFQFFVPMLFQYAVLGFPGLLREWRDEDEEEMGMAALLGPFSALFFIGDLLTMGKDLILGKPWATEARTAPGWDLLADAGKSAKKLATADSDEEVTEALSEIAYSLSAAAGLGLKNISRLANNITEVIDDGIDSGESVLRLLNYSDYTIEGPEEK